MDIHLADGISFEIFQQVPIRTPIIFTTAYDQYAIKAFKVNSIDYLLKPIAEEDLKHAIDKFRTITDHSSHQTQLTEVLEVLKGASKTYKSVYLVQQRDTLIPLSVDSIAYFMIENGIVKAVTEDTNSYTLDKKLEDLETELNPQLFFRANRQFIIQRKAIVNLQLYFNGKLILNIIPQPSETVIISKAKAPLLKNWIHSF